MIFSGFYKNKNPSTKKGNSNLGKTTTFGENENFVLSISPLTPYSPNFVPWDFCHFPNQNKYISVEKFGAS